MFDSLDIHGCPVVSTTFLMYCFSNVNLFLDKCLDKGIQNMSFIQYFVLMEMYLTLVQTVT